MEVSGQLHASATLPPEKAPGIHWIGRWLGLSAGLDAVVKRKIPSPYRISNPDHPARSLVYTDWAIPAPRYGAVLRHMMTSRCESFTYNSSECRTCCSCCQEVCDLFPRYGWMQRMWLTKAALNCSAITRLNSKQVQEASAGGGRGTLRKGNILY
jgi:hypothetical protein